MENRTPAVALSKLARTKAQGEMFGEIVADLVIRGASITEVLSSILRPQPESLSDAILLARGLQRLQFFQQHPDEFDTASPPSSF